MRLDPVVRTILEVCGVLAMCGVVFGLSRTDPSMTILMMTVPVGAIVTYVVHFMNIKLSKETRASAHYKTVQFLCVFLVAGTLVLGLLRAFSTMGTYGSYYARY